MNEQKLTIALAGNPNVGKTTLFNALTGSRQVVGNWPGVTVEQKKGYYQYQGQRFDVVDLPGIYSFLGGSPDEQIARDYIFNEKPDLVVNIVDSSNLERNLYLTLQLMEYGIPMLILLSMCDITERNGIAIDTEHLQSHLGVKVISATLTKGLDVDALMQEIANAVKNPSTPIAPHYDEVVENALERIQAALKMEDASQARKQALNYLEKELPADLAPELKDLITKEISGIEKHRGQEITNVIADDRYAYIRGLARDVINRSKAKKLTYSDRIDKVALSGIFGLPMFFVVMYLVFLVAVKLSDPLIGLIEGGFEWLFVEQWGALLSSWNLPDWLVFILADAIGGGITTIASFIPPIFFIFLCLALLEDSGYMARAAFVADKFLTRIGLPGRAFIPLMVGFGCTVPAIMATRTLESKRDRIFASLLTPFMSCGAKLPVYTFLAMIFFPKHANLVIFGLYMFGIVMALIFGLMLKKTIFKSPPGSFVMELPAYHMPTFRGIMGHTWFRLRDFILRAGKTILIAIILMNLLQLITVPFAGNESGEASLLELAGRGMAPILEPMGIGAHNWQAGVSLVSGLFAKEAIVGTLQSLYQRGGSIEDASANIMQGFGSSAAALAYMVFVLLYAPCAAALAVLFKEHGFKWLAFSFVYLTIMAWILAVLVYQIIAFSATSLLWIGVAILMAVAFYYSMKLIGRSKNNAFQ
jgi:ferrous iron transport protein B